jgi:hypothetical protein
MAPNRPFGRRRLQSDPAVLDTAAFARGLVAADSEARRTARTRRLATVAAVALTGLVVAPTLWATAGDGWRSAQTAPVDFAAMSPEDLARLEPAAGGQPARGPFQRLVEAFGG